MTVLTNLSSLTKLTSTSSNGSVSARGALELGRVERTVAFDGGDYFETLPSLGTSGLGNSVHRAKVR